MKPFLNKVQIDKIPTSLPQQALDQPIEVRKRQISFQLT